MAITLTCILSPTRQTSPTLIDVAVGQLADVAQAVLAGQDLDERAEILDARDAAFVDLADLHRRGQRLDLAQRRLGAIARRCWRS